MKITIITITYNSRNTIEKTIHSVLEQKYDDTVLSYGPVQCSIDFFFANGVGENGLFLRKRRRRVDQIYKTQLQTREIKMKLT